MKKKTEKRRRSSSSSSSSSSDSSSSSSSSSTSAQSSASEKPKKSHKSRTNKPHKAPLKSICVESGPSRWDSANEEPSHKRKKSTPESRRIEDCELNEDQDSKNKDLSGTNTRSSDCNASRDKRHNSGDHRDKTRFDNRHEENDNSRQREGSYNRRGNYSRNGRSPGRREIQTNNRDQHESSDKKTTYQNNRYGRDDFRNNRDQRREERTNTHNRANDGNDRYRDSRYNHRNSNNEIDNRHSNSNRRDNRDRYENRGDRTYQNNRNNRRRSRSGSFDHSNAVWGKERGSKHTDKNQESDVKKEKEKPNFGLSGKLTEETNTYRGVVIKYSEPPEARKPKRRWRLYPFKGEKALQTLYIHRESAYLIGRDRKVVDIPVDHPSCSKQHAALQYRLVPFTREDGSQGKRVRPYLIDLESANGTYINNKKIDPKKYVELLEKDVIKFGFSSREYVLLHDNSKDDALDDDVKMEEEKDDIKVKKEEK